MGSLLAGLGLGFFVAAQLGPLSLFLIRSTLRGRLVTGLAIGAGIAVIDGLYAALGAAGAAPLLTIDGLRTVLGLLGAAVLDLPRGRRRCSARSGFEPGSRRPRRSRRRARRS